MTCADRYFGFTMEWNATQLMPLKVT
jgi:hypothetical protein